MKRYPISVTFCFKNIKERDAVLGQLSDGWGENYVDLEWDGKTDLKDAKVINVRPIDFDE